MQNHRLVGVEEEGALFVCHLSSLLTSCCCTHTDKEAGSKDSLGEIEQHHTDTVAVRHHHERVCHKQWNNMGVEEGISVTGNNQ